MNSHLASGRAALAPAKILIQKLDVRALKDEFGDARLHGITSLRVVCRIPCKKEGTVRVAAKHVNIHAWSIHGHAPTVLCTIALRDVYYGRPGPKRANLGPER